MKIKSNIRSRLSGCREYLHLSPLPLFLFIFLSFFTFSNLQGQSVTMGDVSSKSGGQASEYTMAHTVEPGSNKMLIVGVSLLDTGTGKEVVSVTFGGTPLTEISNTVGPVNRVQVFRLMSPAEVTANVKVDIEGTQTNKAVIGAISFYGVNQSTPTDPVKSNTNQNSSSSLSFNSTNGDMVMDIIGTGSPISTTALGSNQTEQWNIPAVSGGSKETAASTEAGASSVAMDWSFDSSHQFTHVGFNINSTADTSPPTITNVALGASAGNLTFRFDSDEQLGSSSSDIAVSVDGPTTTDIYSFNRNEFSETDNGNSYTYRLTATQAYNDGEGTYTAAVDDALDSAGNDGADGTQTDTYNYDTSTNTWESSTGPTPRDWSTAANWSVGIPTSGQTITIPSTPQNNPDKFPQIQSRDTVASLDIRNEATLNVDNSYAITVTDSVVGSGQLIITKGQATIGGNISIDSLEAGDSRITLNGSSQQIISGLVTADTLQTVNTSSGGVVLSDSLTIHSLLDVSDVSSTLSLESGSALKARDISGNGSITSSGASFYIGGDVSISSLDATSSDVTFNGTSESQTISNVSEYQNLTINNTHSTDRVVSKSNVIVNNTLSLKNGDLVMASGTNLIAPSRSLSGGTIRFQLELSSPGWYNLSSPVASTYKDFLDSIITQGYPGAFYSTGSNPGDTLQPNVLYYKESVGGTDNEHWRVIDAASDTVTEARGHFVYVFGDVSNDTLYERATPHTLEVGGREFDGNGSTVNFDITYTDTATSDSITANRGWNLVGNPYGATIDWDDEANWTKTNMDSVIYVWDQSTNDYLTWNGVDGSLSNGLIAPFQGFWVKANGSSPALSVNNSAKTTGGQFHGKSEREPASIAFKLQAGDLEETMHLTLSSIGRYGKDPRDAFRLLPFDTRTYLTLYTTLKNGVQLSINNLPRIFGKEVDIPVYVGGFKNGAPLGGNYTLSWPDFGNIPDEWSLILEDKETNKKIDLRKNTFYSFNLDQSKKKTTVKKNIKNYQLTRNPKIAKAKSNTENRFVLHIKPGNEIQGLPGEYALESNYPNPFSGKTNIKFSTPKKGPVKIMIYDILGQKIRTLIDKTLPAARHEIPWNPSRLASGVYICVMRAGGEQFSKKITYIK